MLNSLTLTRFLRDRYQSPFRWVLNLIMNFQAISVVNERSFSHFSYVDNPYRNNMNEDLLEGILQLNISSKRKKRTAHFESMSKAKDIKAARDALYNNGALKESVNDYNLQIHDDEDDEFTDDDESFSNKRFRESSDDDSSDFSVSESDHDDMFFKDIYDESFTESNIQVDRDIYSCDANDIDSNNDSEVDKDYSGNSDSDRVEILNRDKGRDKDKHSDTKRKKREEQVRVSDV